MLTTRLQFSSGAVKKASSSTDTEFDLVASLCASCRKRARGSTEFHRVRSEEPIVGGAVLGDEAASPSPLVRWFGER